MPAAPLYCPKCAALVTHGIPACPSCGVPFVQQAVTPTGAQPVYQQQPAPHLSEANNKKMTAGLCAIFLGFLGVHKFILGYHGAGWVYLGLFIGSVVTCIFSTTVIPIMGTLSFVEGIIYLTKTDEDFYQTYMVNRREWF